MTMTPRLHKFVLTAHITFWSAGLVRPDQGSITSAPRWVYVVGIHAIGLVLLFVVLHLTGRGLPSH